MGRDAEYEKRRQDMIFYPALMPLEAAMLPAGERKPLGALLHAKREMMRFFGRAETSGAQRTKIWVR